MPPSHPQYPLEYRRRIIELARRDGRSRSRPIDDGDVRYSSDDQLFRTPSVPGMLG
jgi:hypothetical protein